MRSRLLFSMSAVTVHPAVCHATQLCVMHSYSLCQITLASCSLFTLNFTRTHHSVWKISFYTSCCLAVTKVRHKLQYLVMSCWMSLRWSVMGKSQLWLGFKLRFENFLGVIWQFKDSIRQPTIGIRFGSLFFAIHFGSWDSTVESLSVVAHLSFLVFSCFTGWVNWF